MTKFLHDSDAPFLYALVVDSSYTPRNSESSIVNVIIEDENCSITGPSNSQASNPHPIDGVRNAITMRRQIAPDKLRWLYGPSG
ncbi:MAG: hypothetical protein E6J90_21250 [Deltaproteobacteria bacterium]|nr:MAG: hypothetical protein E6J91_36270 [Deltaproteobacteria bacterium]TMQ18003.1 MAG: hypothetical protein E6J90_21250 [Deltaproteobacteria bacterium]